MSRIDTFFKQKISEKKTDVKDELRTQELRILN